MPMTAEQFRAAIDSIGMPQEGAADNGVDAFLGVNPRTVRRWAKGDAVIPDGVAMLLRIMVAHRWRPDRVRQQYADSRERATP